MAVPSAGASVGGNARTREEALLQLGQIAPVEQNALAEYLKKVSIISVKFDYFNSCVLSFINYLFVIFPIWRPMELTGGAGKRTGAEL